MHLTFFVSHTRSLIATGASLSSIGLALFLRYLPGNPHREGITSLLGYEWRAVLEHLLSAFGIPLTVGLFGVYLTMAMCWVSHAICKRLGWTWEPIAKHPNEVVTLENLPFLVSIVSCVYFIAAVLWERSQAFESVYGGPPRGDMQWTQLGIDILGTALASGIAYWATKPPRQPVQTAA